MNQIAVLDQSTIDKIAAGEVIERPASIVKELVENAIDAGANAITIEIKEGGISFIRITDNGMGIAAKQIPTAFLRHATSKIRVVEDLLDVTSLGFRGEALSSIAAVCQVELISKTPESLTGTRYLIEGGKEKSIEEIGAPSGTTFLVRNIFYNTPARKKFLKSAQTEAGYISDIVERIALSHPEISFKFIANGQTKLHTSGNHNLKDVIYHVFGRDIAANLVEIDAKCDFVHIRGFIGKPVISRGNRNYENYFVNGRYIRSNIISKGIEDAYHTFMMKHKYPFTALQLTIDGDQLDINVHPTKMELRFAQNEQMYHFVYETVRNALTNREMIVQVSVGKDEKNTAFPKLVKQPIPEPFEVKRRQMESAISQPVSLAKESAPRMAVQPTVIQTTPKLPEAERSSTAHKFLNHNPYADNAPLKAENLPQKENSSQKTSFPDGKAVDRADNTYKITPNTAKAADSTVHSYVNKQPIRQEQLNLFDNKLLSKENIKEHRIIGQLFDTYWLVQFQDKLFIIDQHAAHEKVLYERMMKSLKKREYTSQNINPPVILTLSMAEVAILQKYQKRFEEIGFEIEEFGGKEYALRAVPDNLFGLAQEDLFLEMLDSLSGPTDAVSLESMDEKIASMSCKAAVKGNARISTAEIHALIDELMTLENPYNCPHGRPTIISMSKYDIERKFKRIV